MAKCLDDDGDGLISLVPDIIFHRSYRNFGQHNGTWELEYGDFDDFLATLPVLLFYFVSVLLNCYLLYLNVKCVDRRRCKRLPLLVINLAICNITLAVGFLFYTITIDIYYHVDDIETIARHHSRINATTTTTGITFFAVLRELLKYQTVHNFVYIQALFILFIAADGYLSLFIDHNPNQHSALLAVVLLSLPYVLPVIFFDVRILELCFSPVTATVVCLMVLALTPSLTFVLVICTLIRQRQIKAPFRIRNRSLTIALLVIIIWELFEKWGLVLELVETNFCVNFIIGNPEDDHNLRVFLDSWYELAHGLTLLMPFMSALILLLIVRSYREQLVQHLQLIWQRIRCTKSGNRTDYSTETMRSIIAEQTRARQFRNYTSNIEIF